jgi:hypothetical protein
VPLAVSPEGGHSDGDRRALIAGVAHPPTSLQDKEELRSNRLVVADAPLWPDVHAANLYLARRALDRRDDYVDAAEGGDRPANL